MTVGFTAGALTDQLRGAWAVRNRPIDLHAELAAVLASAGLAPEDSGGEIAFQGMDPIVSSTLALASAPALALVAKSVAQAKLLRLRGGPGQDIAMDLRRAPHRLCPFYDHKWEKLNGLVPGLAWDVDGLSYGGFYHTADDRWVYPQLLYPKLKTDLLRLLDATDSPAAVTHRIAGWKAAELEEAAAAAGVVLTMARSLPEFLAERQYREVLADMPLIEIEKIGDSAPEPLPSGAAAPMAGIRALGHAHIIAGAGIGRTLSLHGADVLNIWRHTDIEADFLYHTANVGVRSSLLDLGDADHVATLRALLRDADVFFANRRPGYLARHGLSAEQVAELRPGIVHVSVSLFGETGPWADRVGFDQSAGTATGMALLEGTEDAPRLPIVGVVNDWIMPWLATVGIAAALERRAREGGSYRIRMCLSRVALWIMSLGLFDKHHVAEILAAPGEEHLYLDPETFAIDSPLGHYTSVTEQVHMSETPGRFPFGLLPRGSSRPQWLSSAEGK
ncbi:CoA transferase [Nocardia sp. CDC159]|uniref:CoA transferase n=1 Tax=Nocardia pulmonis TaxID=2951408 RepID=A0A9X2EEE1_9NOCA|nr:MULTISPECIES: CoA transferase [Nocardia]MCM6778924.1 CoA transferase [Nocardia pulmonis]MCM6791823.1 CoA transferase [Nocardia sp. CDC159]